MKRIILLCSIAGVMLTLITNRGMRAGQADPSPPEILTLRTEVSQTFADSAGKRLKRVYMRPRYFRSGGEMRTIALGEEAETSGAFTRKTTGASYTCRFNPVLPDAGHRIEYGGYHVTFTPAGDWTGMTVSRTALPEGIKENVTLTEEASHTVMWTVETDAAASFDGGRLTITDSAGNELFTAPPPWAEDAGGGIVPVTATCAGDTLIYVIEPPEQVTWPVTVDPFTLVGGATVKTGSGNANSMSYQTARSATSATTTYPYNIYTGQTYNSGSGLFTVFRGYLTFNTSSLPDNALIDSARVKLTVTQDYSTADFYIYLVEGTFDASGDMGGGWFNDFAGWQSSGVYPVTQLAGAIGTAGISVGDTLVFTLNGYGLDAVNRTGYTTMTLLSYRDVEGSQPTMSERIGLEYNTSRIEIWYRENYVEAPTNFAMTAVDTATVVCAWTDNSINEQCFHIIDLADSGIVATLPANTVSHTIGGLPSNGRFVWTVAADSSGWRAYALPDSAHTLLPPPQRHDIRIRPVSSDSLRIAVSVPPNPSSDQTGLEIDAVSGSGATDSGWLTGKYAYRDGVLDSSGNYVYRARYRNGDGVPTSWSETAAFGMNGLDTLVVAIARDGYDDYTPGGGAGARDSTVVRAGASDSGARLDAFMSFTLPPEVHRGGVDSMILTMRRTSEQAGTTPTVTVRGIATPDLGPVEEASLDTLSVTGSTLCWTINNGAGERSSENLRNVFLAWQELAERMDYHAGFGVKLDGGSQADGVRAVFLDASHPDYDEDTRLTIIFTPGAPDTLDGTPDGFTLTVLGPDSIRAAWNDNSTTEYGYVLMNAADGLPVAEADTLASSTVEATVTGLGPDTGHSWYVRAFTVFDEASSATVTGRTEPRTPGLTSVTRAGDGALGFILDPRDNPSWTLFAVQDSLSGKYIDGGAEPDTLRKGTPGSWIWRTFGGWGGESGGTLAGLAPDSLYVLRAKAKSGE